jgi:putative transposase
MVEGTSSCGTRPEGGLRDEAANPPYRFYLAMGETEQQRQSRYAAFVSRGVRPSELMLIREALQRGQLTGSERFVDEIDRKLGVRVERRGQGRPAKCKK